MSLRNILFRRSRLIALGSLIAIALVATATGLVSPGPGGNEVSAQVRGCETNQLGILCLRKDAPDSRIPFVFEIERDVRTLPRIEQILCVDTVDEETNLVEVLRGGEELEIEFGCGIRVIERREPGWNLLDIDCDYEDIYYDVQREDGGIMILVDRSQQDSFTTAEARLDIRCRFVNRPVERQPLNLGGLFSGQPTPLPTAPSAVAPAATAPVITPPRTGDGGIK